MLGAYPSAFHIVWTPPTPPRGAPASTIAAFPALAVDVEPEVFWDGSNPSPATLLDDWLRDVGFKPAWGVASVGTNGPSGKGLVSEYLDPLGIDMGTAWVTDAVPWYFVKMGAKSQGDSIKKRFNPIAERLRITAGDLPARPNPRAFVEIALETQRGRLREELVDVAAPLVITLGQEAADTLVALVDRSSHPGTSDRLQPDDTYGLQGEVAIGGWSAVWLRLAHPGLIRQAKQVSPWRVSHDAWKSATREARPPS
ncbi:MAG: hypothetical protein AB7Q42_05315 [Acidimicrobiia bacterium]